MEKSLRFFSQQTTEVFHRSTPEHLRRSSLAESIALARKPEYMSLNDFPTDHYSSVQAWWEQKLLASILNFDE
jgi:hypothetical protein